MQEECPLCGCNLDDTDKNFKPCPCNYQVCSFCFNKLMNESEIPLCPACRQPYKQFKIKFTPPSKTTVNKNVKKKKKKDQSSKKKEENIIKNRKELENVRVLQRNLVYITNIPLSLAKEEVLKKYEYFGQYGNITKIVINKGKYFNTTAPGGPSVSAYVTFEKKRLEDTYLCILAVDGCWLENRTLRASYGTTKYCSFFLKNISCTNTNCMYLHSLGKKEDSFTKEEMTQGKHLIDDYIKLDLATIQKPTKPSVLPPPGTIAKNLPKDKRKKGIFDPNERKEINIKLPNRTESNDENDQNVDELSHKMEFTGINETEEKEKEEDDSNEEEEEGEEQSDQDDSNGSNSDEAPKIDMNVHYQKMRSRSSGNPLKFKEPTKGKNVQFAQMPRRKPSGETEEESLPPIGLNMPRRMSSNPTDDYDYKRFHESRRSSEGTHERSRAQKTKNWNHPNLLKKSLHFANSNNNNNNIKNSKKMVSESSIYERDRDSRGDRLPSIFENEDGYFSPLMPSSFSMALDQKSKLMGLYQRDENSQQQYPPFSHYPEDQNPNQNMSHPYMMNPNYYHPQMNPQQFGYINDPNGDDNNQQHFLRKIPNVNVNFNQPNVNPSAFNPNYPPNAQPHPNLFKQKDNGSHFNPNNYPPNNFFYPNPQMPYNGFGFQGYQNFYSGYPPVYQGNMPNQNIPPQNIPPQNIPNQNLPQGSVSGVQQQGGTSGNVPTSNGQTNPTSNTPPQPSRTPSPPKSSTDINNGQNNNLNNPSTQNIPINNSSFSSQQPISKNHPNNNINNNNIPSFYTHRNLQDNQFSDPSLNNGRNFIYQVPMYHNTPVHPMQYNPQFHPYHNNPNFGYVPNGFLNGGNGNGNNPNFNSLNGNLLNNNNNPNFPNNNNNNPINNNNPSILNKIGSSGDTESDPSLSDESNQNDLHKQSDGHLSPNENSDPSQQLDLENNTTNNTNNNNTNNTNKTYHKNILSPNLNNTLKNTNGFLKNN